MAWGKSSKPAAPPSTIGTLLPLIILLVIVGGIAFVAYHVWVASQNIGKQASAKMGKKNVIFSKDGMRVGVRHVENERYVDATQKWVVKAWDHASNAKGDGKKSK
ncbi:hypothetical protein PspLS_02644 [Pyricularia sp. CBS 133598]|nr:hypothetical protein PspLS_02644 [Pyricularia sp. CBS 133598]